MLRVPLAIEPSHFLIEARFLKCSHASRDIVAAVLRPAFMVTVASGLNSCREFLHEDSHCGVDLFKKAFPVMPHTFLKSREFGNFSNPPRATVAGQVLVDELVKTIGRVKAVE